MNAVSDYIYNFITNSLDCLGALAPFLSCFLIIIESMIPVLPLFVFITINFLAFGKIIGFLISWICTIIGCLISFNIVKKLTKKRIDRLLEKHQKISKLIFKIKNLSLSKITIVLAIPFTPAFAVNIAAGLARIPAKKYFCSLAIGKIFLVYFWGFIGTSLLESFKDPLVLLKVIMMIIISYILSKIISKIFGIA